MIKYPVTSETGNVYEVEVETDDYRGEFGDIAVRIYKREKRTGLFGRAIDEKILVDKEVTFKLELDREHEGSYVKLVKYCVKKYEETCEWRRERSVAEEKSRGEFEEWNGNC